MGFEEFLQRLILTEERRAATDERVAIALERLAEAHWAIEMAEALRTIASGGSESAISKAIRIYVQEGGCNVTELAKRVGVSRSKLYGSREFREAKRRVDLGSGDGVARSAVRADEM